MFLRAALAVCLFAPAAPAADPPPLDPKTTWAFLVSTVEHKGGVVEKGWKEGRRDTELAKAFADWGLVADRLVFLKDREGTLPAIKQKMAALLERSKPGDTFVFYFAGHGGRDLLGPGKSSYWFENYDSDEKRQNSYLYMALVFDLVEKHFKGSRALLTADCCHSGGLAAVANNRKGPIAFTCLASAAPHNSSTGNWTFTNCLIAALRGDRRVDADGDGALTLGELNHYVQLRMAVLEQQKATFRAAGDFAKAKLATAKGPKPAGHVGQLLEAQYEGKWYRAEVLEEKGERYKLDWPDWGSADWHPKAKTRPFEPKAFAVGTAVQARSEEDDKWRPATVVAAFHGLHHVKFDGKSADFNEWLRADRVRARP